MTRNTYNVIWVDDEISAILNERTIELLASEDIRVIATATHADGAGGLEELLRKHTAKGITNDRVDAVITDANFNVSEDTLNSKGERDTSGLSYVLMLTKKYDTLPFYLYTGRSEEMLLDKYDDGELNEFKNNNRWFAKGFGLMPLIDQIKEDVDKMNSLEFKIRNQYHKEFLAAAKIPGAEALLTKGLLAKEDNAALIDLFNDARMVFERICDKLQEYEFIPFLSSINNVSRFLGGQNVDPYEHIQKEKPIMDKALARATWFFVGIVNDGSHDQEKSELKVKEYVRNTHSSNLFYSVLHILMDILRWYDELIPRTELKKQWRGNYIAFSKVYLASDNRTFYAMDGANKCILQNKEGLDAKSVVAIIKHSEKDDRDGYKYFSKSNEYDIIERSEACISRIIN